MRAHPGIALIYILRILINIRGENTLKADSGSGDVETTYAAEQINESSRTSFCGLAGWWAGLFRVWRSSLILSNHQKLLCWMSVVAGTEPWPDPLAVH